MKNIEKLKIVVIGGDWNSNGGRTSSYISKLASSMESLGAKITTYNGGYYEDLCKLVEQNGLQYFNCICWMANVPNDLPKKIDIKELYPKAILVTSKRNNNEYSFQELIRRSLIQKANLTIDFRKAGDIIEARLFDPLGVLWQEYTSDIPVFAQKLLSRINELTSLTRQKTVQISEVCVPVPDEKDFFDLIKNYAHIFHELVAPAEGTNRFLGNSAFRCLRGFPGFRNGTHIFVSRRNVDKRFIGQDSFVAVEFKDDNVYYFGPDKPSVDTPIQVRLFEKLPNIMYMIHGHVYVDGAPYSRYPISCGALEEVEEIMSYIKDRNTDFFCLNLLGHGFIAMATKVDALKNIAFIARTVPEKV